MTKDQPSPKTQSMSMRWTHYNAETIAVEEHMAWDPSLLHAPGEVAWLDVVAPHQELLNQMVLDMDWHPLIKEYHSMAGQRPSFYALDQHLLISARMLSETDADAEDESIAIVLGEGYLVSFQEREGDAFHPVRERLTNNIGALRKRKADQLLYRVLDALCDPYFLVAESLEEAMEDMQETIEAGELDEVPAKLRQFRAAISSHRRSVAPLRDVIAGLIKSESPLLSKAVYGWLRELHQQSMLLVDTSEQLRERLSDLQAHYQVAQNDRLNETMRLLTIVSTFFIPLTFLVGVYGMNFEHMPETKWSFGYPMFWGLSILLALGMAIAFRRRGWF